MTTELLGQRRLVRTKYDQKKYWESPQYHIFTPDIDYWLNLNLPVRYQSFIWIKKEP